jgi:DNA-binding transcriptional ArsR family regulator
MAARGLTAEERAKVFKALSDPRRLDIVDALTKNGAQCGTQLAEQLDVSIALLCHHWDILIDAGLVKKKRVGQLRVCTLDADRLREATQFAPAPAPHKKPARRKKLAKSRATSKAKSVRRAGR